MWEDLVKLTDGLYPAEMAFGPDDIGHWKDKLPYVRHDLERIAGRQRTLSGLGRFDFGFDFGAPVNHARDLARYRSIPYSLRNSVEPRMSLAARATLVAFLRSGQRAGTIKGDETIQTGIERLDALKRALDESYGRGLAVLEYSRQVLKRFRHISPHWSRGSGCPIAAGIRDARPSAASTTSAIK